MGSWFDGFPLALISLLLIAGMIFMINLRNAWLQRARRAVQTISLLVFALFVYQCLCLMRLFMFGLGEIGKNDLVSFSQLSLFAVVGGFSFFAGRIFCGWVCPLGFLQEIVNSISPVKGKAAKLILLTALFCTALVTMLRTLPANEFAVEYVTAVFAFLMMISLFLLLISPALEQALMNFRYVPMFVYSALSLLGIYFSDAWCSLYGFEADTSSLISLCIVLSASFIVATPWCRFMCPTGLFLALIGKDAFYRLKLGHLPPIHEPCRQACPSGAISEQGIDCLLCISCGTCKETCGSKYGFFK